MAGHEDAKPPKRDGDTPKRDWQIRLSAIIWFVLLVLFLFSVPVLLDWSVWTLPAIVALSAVLALIPAWLWHRFVHRSVAFVRSYLKVAVFFTFVLTTLIAAPVYYLAVMTAVKPAIVPQVTLTDGKKTVVFQGMQHIGSEPFYKGIIYDLEKALSENFVIYYEGVIDSTPEGNAWFSQTLAGGGDLSANYKSLAESCGLVFQLDYFQLLAPDMRAHPERHVTADVTTLQMKQEYDRLMASDPEFARQNTKAKSDDADEDGTSGKFIEGFINTQSNGTPGQKALAGTLCRGVISLVMSHDAQAGDDSPMEPVVLTYRNRMLAERIISDDNSKIYVTYGAAHLPGVIALLQQSDPNWRIVSEKWSRTISAPEQFRGYQLTPKAP